MEVGMCDVKREVHERTVMHPQGNGVVPHIPCL